jgi:hypothetical protein
MLRGRRDTMLTLAFSLPASDPGFGRLDVLWKGLETSVKSLQTSIDRPAESSPLWSGIESLGHF